MLCVRDQIITRPITILALFAACTESGPSGPGIEGESHIASYYLPAVAPPMVDILFVIDDTTAMAPHQQALSALPEQIEQLFTGTEGFSARYQLGVVTTDAATDGNMRRSSLVSEAFIAHDASYLAAPPNYEGSLADAFASVLPTSVASTATNQPLETARRALIDNVQNAGFLRDRAYLGLFIVTASDDASPATPAEYASALRELKSDPANVWAVGTYELGAPRLDELFALFPNRNETYSIDEPDFASALGAFTQLYKTTLGYNCVEPPADLDPDMPGPQVDCAFVSIADDGSEQRLPMCDEAATGPCWEIVEANPQICSYSPETGHLQTRGFTSSASAFGDAFHPTIRGECVVN